MKITVCFPTGDFNEDGSVKIKETWEKEVSSIDELDNILNMIEDDVKYFVLDENGKDLMQTILLLGTTEDGFYKTKDVVKPLDLDVKAYAYGEYIISIIDNKEDNLYEAWIMRKDLGVSSLMFGYNKKVISFDVFKEIAFNAVNDYIKMYCEEFDY